MTNLFSQVLCFFCSSDYGFSDLSSLLGGPDGLRVNPKVALKSLKASTHFSCYSEYSPVPNG